MLIRFCVEICTRILECWIIATLLTAHYAREASHMLILISFTPPRARCCYLLSCRGEADTLGMKAPYAVNTVSPSPWDSDAALSQVHAFPPHRSLLASSSRAGSTFHLSPNEEDPNHSWLGALVTTVSVGDPGHWALLTPMAPSLKLQLNSL